MMPQRQCVYERALVPSTRPVNALRVILFPPFHSPNFAEDGDDIPQERRDDRWRGRDCEESRVLKGTFLSRMPA